LALPRLYSALNAETRPARRRGLGFSSESRFQSPSCTGSSGISCSVVKVLWPLRRAADAAARSFEVMSCLLGAGVAGESLAAPAAAVAAAASAMAASCCGQRRGGDIGEPGFIAGVVKAAFAGWAMLAGCGPARESAG